MAQTSSSRFAYLDNLRSFVVLLVVVMHSNVTYSGMGSWYYREVRSEQLSLVPKLLFALYGCFTQAWFMGLLFFVSGLLAAGAFARKGTGAFLRERLFRLGAPLLLYMLVVHPLTVYFFVDHGRYLHTMNLALFYAGFLFKGYVFSATGPLWFAEALLLFCFAYAGFRALRARPQSAPKTAPSGSTFLGLALLTGIGAFLIRLVWPIGTNVLNLQFCFFASYIVLFILGVRAGEQKWLEAIPETSSRRWLHAGLWIGIPAWFLLIVATRAPWGRPALIEGGLHWQAAGYAIWEGFVAIAMSIGLLGFFRRRVNHENRFTRLLSSNCFRIYMFHTPILVAISVLLASWQAPALLKHAVVAPLACLASLVLSEWILRRIPGLESITR
jgi:glucans biosynthesis protein C